MELSVVIITKNEERNIGRCLASVKGIADDVVVLDSFSTDRTEAIAKEHGARFLQPAFDGHIEQKNRAITHAKNPWVLSLDADEALDERLARSIQRETVQRLGQLRTVLTAHIGNLVHIDRYRNVCLGCRRP